jgi:hypothetical protein
MSISTSITGGSASNQLMDLLAVVANPDVYKAKLDALDAATAENKKYVEAVAPVSEILALREQTKALREEAESYQNAAIAQADADLTLAKNQAASIVSSAQVRADGLIASAVAAKAESDALLVASKEAMRQAEVAQAVADNAKASAAAQAIQLTKALEDAAAAQAEAEAAKADILAKHQAFVQGL